MASPITLRLDPELRRQVARIARRRRTTTSTVLREAIAAWVAREDQALTPYERAADLIGSVRGGDPNLSENTGRKLTALLKARRGY